MVFKFDKVHWDAQIIRFQELKEPLRWFLKQNQVKGYNLRNSKKKFKKF